MLKDKLIAEAKLRNAQCSFVIADLKGTDTWEYRSDVTVPSASLIKIFLLIEAVRRQKEQTLILQEMIAVSREHIVPFSVLEFLEPREYTVGELLRLMMVYSDNTATNVLMDFLGMDRINQCIRELGCTESLLCRKMMDFQAAREGRENRTAAGEMAELLKRLYEGRLLGEPYDTQILDIMKGQADECMMRTELPDEIVIARKSGELDCLDHDIAIVYGRQTHYLYCFFVWDAASNNEAREILAKTSKIVYDFFEGNKN